MKKAIVFSLLLILFCFSLSSSQLLIKDPNWKNGEKFSYEIRHEDSLLGRMDYLITDTFFEKNRAYQIEAITSVDYQGQNTSDSVSLIIKRANLKPLFSDHKLITSQMALKFQARYLSDKVKVRLDSPQGTKETDIGFPKDGYDNDEIVLLLRALDLKEGSRYTFKDVSPTSTNSYPVEIQVMKPEKVKTSNGEYLCNKLKMKVAGKEVEMWYQKDKPNLMVKYSDLQAGTVMLLKEFK